MRLITINLGEYYHVYSRGVEKRKIFLDDLDYFRFTLLLCLCNTTENIQLSKIFRDLIRKKKKPGQGEALTRGELLKLFDTPIKERLVSIVSYCLMPNHFHLILKEIKESGISVFMQKFLTAYSMHFNKKYKRSGPLFVKPFKAKPIDSDNYFRYLFSYLHLNPIKLIESKWKENGIKDLSKAKKFLQEYRYSSYLDFLGKDRPEKKILSFNDVPDYFESLNIKEFKDFVESWLETSTLFDGVK